MDGGTSGALGVGLEGRRLRTTVRLGLRGRLGPPVVGLDQGLRGSLGVRVGGRRSLCPQTLKVGAGPTGVAEVVQGSDPSIGRTGEERRKEEGE